MKVLIGLVFGSLLVLPLHGQDSPLFSVDSVVLGVAIGDAEDGLRASGFDVKVEDVTDLYFLFSSYGIDWSVEGIQSWPKTDGRTKVSFDDILKAVGGISRLSYSKEDPKEYVSLYFFNGKLGYVSRSVSSQDWFLATKPMNSLVAKTASKYGSAISDRMHVSDHSAGLWPEAKRVVIFQKKTSFVGLYFNLVKEEGGWKSDTDFSVSYFSRLVIKEFFSELEKEYKKNIITDKRDVNP